ncbi:MAG: hypothetical protein BGP04_21090 [Rhizobiales bacterium 62-17]|nr:substrate-binding domain-containing protein [Hyphomicrobiales bacterium]OJY00113.1 MAG: hypothetical protein BGP04_21090 [Rhizobiales bacterium 62-17]
MGQHRWRLAGLVLLVASSSMAQAAEVKVLSGMGMRAILTQLTGAFEQASGHKLLVTYDTAGLVRDRLRRDEAADVAIMQRSLFETLPSESLREPPTDLARSIIGLVGRAGAPQPDIGSVETLKQALLAAQSISYTDPANGGLSGSHFAKIIERLGIAEQIRDKTRLGKPMARVSEGEVEYSVLQLSEILSLRNVQLVGAFPDELQDKTAVSVARLAGSHEPEAGRALIGFLSGPAAAAVIKTHGMEPIARQ